ncbi:MAG: hypothetical protein JNL28_10195 [Planctomycetes bacterium]|nr:hypothetical protein [Planctomycetota bacterium]
MRLHSAFALLILTAPAFANERRFAYSYEATTVPKGQFELENWITYKHGTKNDSDFRRVQFRHELEYGLTDRLQLSAYLADWSWTDAGRGSASTTRYDDSAVVLKVNWLDPALEGLGVSTYHEVKVGDEFIELENKLIVQQNVDRFVGVYNLTLEAEWEGRDYEMDNGEIINSLGLSYELSPRLLMGVEAVHEIPLPDWRTGAHQRVLAGPNLSYRFGGAHGWWITTSALQQLTGEDDEAEFEMRLIVGVSL